MSGLRLYKGYKHISKALVLILCSYIKLIYSYQVFKINCAYTVPLGFLYYLSFLSNVSLCLFSLLRGTHKQLVPGHTG